MVRVARALVASSLVAGGSWIAIPHAANASVTPALNVAGIAVSEGDAGSIAVSVPVALSVPAPAKVTATYAVYAGTGVAGSDFVAATGALTFAKGVVQRNIPVTVLSDTVADGDRTVAVSITSITGASVHAGTGVVTIVDDDADGTSSTPEVTVGSETLYEGNAGVQKALIPVTLSSPATSPVVVDFDTTCSSAGTGDYSPIKAKVSFAIGQRLKTVAVRLTPDTATEDDESVSDHASLRSGIAYFVVNPTAVAILDDDNGSSTGGTPPPVGITRVSEPAPGVDASFPTSLTSPCASGAPGSEMPSISDDGRWVAFTSNADNLVPDDTNQVNDVFVRDTWTGYVQRISVAANGTQSNGWSQNPVLTADGRFVLFDSWASNLVAGDTDGWYDTFLVDRQLGTIEAIGPTSIGNSGSFGASISDDGRYVAFSSTAPMAGDIDGTATGYPTSDIFLLDRAHATITLVSTAYNGGPSWGYFAHVSADGHTVLYSSDASRGHVIAGDATTNDYGLDIYAKNLVTGVVDKIDVNDAGDSATGWGPWVNNESMSTDGRYVSFVAEACNLGVACNAVGRSPFQVYLRDRVAGTTTVESVDPSGLPMGFDMTGTSMSATGRYLAFSTGNPTLLASFGATGCGGVVVLRDVVTGTYQRVDAPIGGGCAGQGSRMWQTAGRSISANGQFVAFSSDASNLVPSDNNKADDVFINRLY